MSTLAIDTIQGATTATSVDMSGVTGLQMPAGHVIQVKQTTDDSDFSMQGTSFTDFISVTITPKFNTSKILVRCVIHGASSYRYSGGRLFRVVGGSETAIGQGATGLGSNRAGMFFTIPSNHDNSYWNYVMHNMSGEFLDSPATTSAITYKIKVANTYESSRYVYLNRVQINNDSIWAHRNMSSITALEIAG